MSMLIHLKLLYKDYTQHGTNKVVQWVGRGSADLSTNESDRSFVKNRGTQKFWAQHLYCEQIVNFCLTRSHRACLIIAGTKIQWMYLVVHRCTYPSKNFEKYAILIVKACARHRLRVCWCVILDTKSCLHSSFVVIINCTAAIIH